MKCLHGCLSALTLAMSVSCAGSGTPHDSTRPPEMTSHIVAPELKVPVTQHGAPAPVRLDIEVLIQSDGRPDMSTLKLSGFGVVENEDAIRRWIEQSNFRPARRGDEPVAAIYKLKLAARAEVLRVP
jgi:hypothetical protein